ncbi:MAG TPA: RHS repeat-associated core domain-containing protein, partial [Ktedonobacterales bacterium]|nr:RHS repeat-associated core domain-containing protein [Ktedonobacterales bacterium]
ATGLDYYNARYYDPLASQFTTADSVLPGGGYDPLGLSRYAYVEGNPETRTDASGHCFLVCAVIGAAVGAAVGVAVAAVPIVAAVANHQPITGQMLTNVAVNAALGAGAGAATALNPVGALVGMGSSLAGIALGAATGGSTGLQSEFRQMAVGAMTGALGGAADSGVADLVASNAMSKGAGLVANFGIQGGIAASGDFALQGANVLTGQQSQIDPGELLATGLLAGASTIPGSIFRASSGNYKASASLFRRLATRAAGGDWNAQVTDAFNSTFQVFANVVWGGFENSTPSQQAEPWYASRGTRRWH